MLRIFNSAGIRTIHTHDFGANAFWWLGSGVLYDGAGCTTAPPGSCYYARAAWSANANGAPGTPTWHVSTLPGGGSVTLDCYTCTNVVATATAPSNGCVSDVTVTVSYGPYVSANFTVNINTPSQFTEYTSAPYNSPTDAIYMTTGYVSTTWWTLTDSCGYQDPGLDANEYFGAYVNDYPSTDWGHPAAKKGYNAAAVWGDQIGSVGYSTPSAQTPQSPLGSTKVIHDSPWTFYVGTLTYGSGKSVHADTQQYYRDHGRHF